MGDGWVPGAGGSRSVETCVARTAWADGPGGKPVTPIATPPRTVPSPIFSHLFVVADFWSCLRSSAISSALLASKLASWLAKRPSYTSNSRRDMPRLDESSLNRTRDRAS